MFYQIPSVAVWWRTVWWQWWPLGLFQSADLLMQLSIEEWSKSRKVQNQGNMADEEEFGCSSLPHNPGRQTLYMWLSIIMMQQNDLFLSVVFSSQCVSRAFQWLACNAGYTLFVFCISRVFCECFHETHDEIQTTRHTPFVLHANFVFY